MMPKQDTSTQLRGSPSTPHNSSTIKASPVLCHSLGQQTIWQSDPRPAISSEPAVRLFAGWPAWEAWQEQLSHPSRDELRQHSAAELSASGRFPAGQALHRTSHRAAV